MEQLEIDAAGHAHDPLGGHADRGEPRLDRRRRREAQVDLLVEPADERLHEVTQERQPRHARRVLGDLRVVLGDHRQTRHPPRDQTGDPHRPRRGELHEVRVLREVRHERRQLRHAPRHLRVERQRRPHRRRHPDHGITGCGPARAGRGTDEGRAVPRSRRSGHESPEAERDPVHVIDGIGDDGNARVTVASDVELHAPSDSATRGPTPA